MECISLQFENYRYPFLLGHNCLNEIGERIRAQIPADSYFIIVDTTVARLYRDRFCEVLAPGRATVIEHVPGELGKSPRTLLNIVESAIQQGVTRRSCFVALGGGVTGNIAGLAAALLFRGIRIVHVPTTVVAMLDSVISLKQAVNSEYGKNLIGTFHCPQAVYADVALLDSLPTVQIRSGICEIIKNALAIDTSDISYLEQVLRVDSSYDHSTLCELTRRGVNAKMKLMRYDAREREAALAFEYGHTVGHAIEHLALGEITHGDAVGLGMLVAAEISAEIGGLSTEDLGLHKQLLTKAGVRLKLPKNVGIDQILTRLVFDNKRGYLECDEGIIPMILLSSLGKPIWSGTYPLHGVELRFIKDVLERNFGAGMYASASENSTVYRDSPKVVPTQINSML